MRKKSKIIFYEFTGRSNQNDSKLENAHQIISHKESNDLRLHIMRNIARDTLFNRKYYYAARKLFMHLRK